MRNAIGLLEKGQGATKDEIASMNRRSEELFAVSIEANELGDEEESIRTHQISGILTAIATALESSELSSVALDQCLYYVDNVLTQEFIARNLNDDAVSKNSNEGFRR